MRNVVTISLLCCVLLVLAVPLVQADEPVVITPYVGGPVFYAEAGQEVVIRAGWAACTRGLTEAFTHAAAVSMQVDYDGAPWLNVEPPSREYWSRPQPSGNSTSACVMQTSNYWSTQWLYSLGTLEAGEYSLHFVYTISHPLPDGGDYDGDGRPDLFTPETFINEVDVTIVVS